MRASLWHQSRAGVKREARPGGFEDKKEAYKKVSDVTPS